MEGLRLTLVTLVCVVLYCLRKTSGEEVERKVRRGDDVILYCDRKWRDKSNIVWFRKCSHAHQPTLTIPGTSLLDRYSFKWNESMKTQNLEVRNITESDLGLYYCALETDKQYSYGEKTIRVTLIDLGFFQSDVQSDLHLLFIVCPVCVLLSSTCVYCICGRRKTGSKKSKDIFQVSCVEEHHCEESSDSGMFCYHTEVSYTPVIFTGKSD